MKDFLKNILLVTLPMFIVLFLAAEIFVRVFSSKHLHLAGLTGREKTMNPMQEWANVDAFSAYTAKAGEYKKGRSGKSVNSAGFISTPEIKREKPQNTIRIVFLGGSSTAGTGKNLNDEDTWPWQVAQKLQARLKGLDKPRVEFINAALSGYSTFESYGKLWSRLRFYDPDIVVVNHAWNEMYYFNETIAANPTSWKKHEDGSWRLDNMTYAPQIKPHWIDPFLGWSQALTRVRLRFAEPLNGEAGSGKGAGAALSSTYNKKGLEIFRDNLKMLLSTGAIIGAEVFVMKQPTLITPTTSAEDRVRCRYDYHGFDHNAHVDAYNSVYRIIEQEVDAAHIIDATPVSGVSGYFHDHVHPTKVGAAKIADIVSQQLYTTYLENTPRASMQLMSNK